MRRVRLALALLLTAAATLPACGQNEQINLVVHELDLNHIWYQPELFGADLPLMQEGEFNDYTAVRDAATLQTWFGKTPYNSRSFLETYTSNGVSAANGVLNAAIKFQINPILLLVRMQMEQGLISMQTYPADSKRVEFAFQCGCDGAGNCLPELAGLDKQLECLAAKLNSHQRDLLEYGYTLSDWKVGHPQRTIDGVDVIPPDFGTCALYQIDPVYGESSQSGAWLFAHIYALYRHNFGYWPDGSDPTIGAASVAIEPTAARTAP